MDAVQLPLGQHSHFEGVVYFFQLSLQKFLVLILLTSEERMRDWVDLGATQWLQHPGLVIQDLYHEAIAS